MIPTTFFSFSKPKSCLFVAGLLVLEAFAVKADTVSCLDNIDCQKGEVCIDQGNSPQGICVKRCAPLRLRLAANGTELYSTADGNFTRFKLTVTNWQQFPDELFALSPDLPACGLNTNSSRSWIDIYDNSSDSRIYGFCGFTKAEQLALLWFGVQLGSQPPHEVYVILNDRRTGRKYCSTTISLQN